MSSTGCKYGVALPMDVVIQDVVCYALDMLLVFASRGVSVCVGAGVGDAGGAGSFAVDVDMTGGDEDGSGNAPVNVGVGVGGDVGDDVDVAVEAIGGDGGICNSDVGDGDCMCDGGRVACVSGLLFFLIQFSSPESVFLLWLPLFLLVLWFTSPISVTG
jgi:hypothetical protein